MADEPKVPQDDLAPPAKVLVLGRPEVMQLAVGALGGGEALLEAVSDSRELARHITRHSGGVAVVDMEYPGLNIVAFLRSLNRPPAGPAIILIAETERVARESKVGVGGWVHHLFTSLPPSEHLRQFVASALENQRRRRAFDAEVE